MIGIELRVLLEPLPEGFGIENADDARLAARRHQRTVIGEHRYSPMHEAIMNAFNLDVAADPFGFNDPANAQRVVQGIGACWQA